MAGFTDWQLRNLRQSHRREQDSAAAVAASASRPAGGNDSGVELSSDDDFELVAAPPRAASPMQRALPAAPAAAAPGAPRWAAVSVPGGHSAPSLPAAAAAPPLAPPQAAISSQRAPATAPAAAAPGVPPRAASPAQREHAAPATAAAAADPQPTPPQASSLVQRAHAASPSAALTPLAALTNHAPAPSGAAPDANMIFRTPEQPGSGAGAAPPPQVCPAAPRKPTLCAASLEAAPVQRSAGAHAPASAAGTSRGGPDGPGSTHAAVAAPCPHQGTHMTGMKRERESPAPAAPAPQRGSGAAQLGSSPPQAPPRGGGSAWTSGADHGRQPHHAPVPSASPPLPPLHPGRSPLGATPQGPLASASEVAVRGGAAHAAAQRDTPPQKLHGQEQVHTAARAWAGDHLEAPHLAQVKQQRLSKSPAVRTPAKGPRGNMTPGSTFKGMYSLLELGITSSREVSARATPTQAPGEAGGSGVGMPARSGAGATAARQGAAAPRGQAATGRTGHDVGVGTGGDAPGGSRASGLGSPACADATAAAGRQSGQGAQQVARGHVRAPPPTPPPRRLRPRAQSGRVRDPLAPGDGYRHEGQVIVIDDDDDDADE